MSAILHYIYDPLCGWCYGAEPLLCAAADVEHLDIELHAGGLWPEPTKLPDEMRHYVRQADARIADISGQPFGEAYLSGLLLDPTMVLDSLPTTTAVLAAQSLDPGKALPMLKGIQHAHYEQGRRVVEQSVLCDIALECGLPRDRFEIALGEVAAAAHIDETHQLMGRLGAHGFPSFALQIDDDWLPVPAQQFAGDVAEFRNWLGDRLQAHATERIES